MICTYYVYLSKYTYIYIYIYPHDPCTTLKVASGVSEVIWNLSRSRVEKLLFGRMFGCIHDHTISYIQNIYNTYFSVIEYQYVYIYAYVHP